MSNHQPDIDPALRDLHPPTHAAGVKRKIRAANAAPAPPQPPDGRRITRRTAAALLSPQRPDTLPGDKALIAPDVEPSRGEEENKYHWTPRDNASKRSRHHSPSSHAAVSATTTTRGSNNQWSSEVAGIKAVLPDHNPDHNLPPQGTATPSSSHHSPSLGGIDNLAAAAAAFQSNPRTQLPYPFGLTPFRYHCLTPHLPQPPPGDPNDPAFTPFDPAEGSQQQGSAGHLAPRSPTSSGGTSFDASAHGGQGGFSSLPGSRPASRPSSRGRDEPFASFSSLLAASDAHSTRHSSVTGSHPPSYYGTPDRDGTGFL